MVSFTEVKSDESQWSDFVLYLCDGEVGWIYKIININVSDVMEIVCVL